ncbi:unnamed protein product [Brassicogethes aeneus]|uniref:G-protein coupled receptors family 2 profile 2 domain-containing protein n=1 Tax=Brassicogethes aeneus TaxID=1431903 RepID=A0A9P0B964_BRAAE|nr:unnamed protein product [Brassicogethes aeneus]
MRWFTSYIFIFYAIANFSPVLSNTNKVKVKYIKSDEVSKSDYYLTYNNTVYGCKRENLVCVKKCCPLEEYYEEHGDCVNRVEYNISEFRVYSTPIGENVHTKDFQVIFPNDDFIKTLEVNITLQSKGYILLVSDEYCIEDYTPNNFRLDYSLSQDNERGIKCVGLIISIPFLFLTLVAHFLIQDRNLHMNALMCYVFNLMMSYILLLIVQVIEVTPSWLCALIGHALLYFFISSMFWMNVICFDIYLTFSGRRGFNGMRYKNSKRFIAYSAYAILAPSVLILIVFVINTIVDPEKSYYPGIGGYYCFLQKGLPYLLYLHGPMAILLIMNTTFFVVTAFKIRKVKQETTMLKKGDNTLTSDTKMIHLYMKLILAMGLNWILETLAWALKEYTTLPTEIYVVTDFCNAIYGLFIFVIFVVLNKNSRKMLKQRWKSFTDNMSTTQETRVTSISRTNGELCPLTCPE